MRRRLTLLRLWLPWWLFRMTRPGPALVMDHWYVHGWGRRPAPPRAVRIEAMPPVPTPVLVFALRCVGAQECRSCAAYDHLEEREVVPPVEVLPV